jgi:hypothetical protein
VKTLNVALMGLLATSILGCSKPEPVVVPVDRVVQTTKAVTGKVPAVICYVDTNVSYTEKMTQIAHCLEDYKSTIEVYNNASY